MNNPDLTLSQISSLVEPYIILLLSGHVDTMTIPPTLHQVLSGGKRIRPALLVWSGCMFQAPLETLLMPAASIEILHNATLIIDDIVDHSDLRRNQPTTRKEYGLSITQCVVLNYMVSVFEGLIQAPNSKQLISLYSTTLKTIIDGEIKDILFERSGREDEPFVSVFRYQSISQSDYLKMIEQKTAILFQASCQAGAICANATGEEIKTVGAFGLNLGMSFQIQDDLLDIFGNEREFGKKIGKDIMEKKMGNYVILLALQELSLRDQTSIMNIYEGEATVSAEEIQYIIQCIEKTKAKERAQEKASQYLQIALAHLDQLPHNQFHTNLVDLAQSLSGRQK